MHRKSRSIATGIALALAAGQLSGCATAPAKVAATAAPQPAQQQPAQQQPAQSVPAVPGEKPGAPVEHVLEGRIVDTSDGGGYTYLLVEKDGRSSWSAIPQRQVTIGQQVRLSAGITMVNFRSKALQHTFQEICFSPGIEETPPQSLDSSREAGVLVSKHHPLISDALPKAPLEPPNLPCGTVLESVRGGGFTYLLIANGSTTTWVAIPEAYVAPGSMVVTQQGLLLSSFTSTSLRRTFRDIVFSPGLVR